MTFEQFMEKVDEAVTDITGMGAMDFSDYMYRDAYDNGEDPEDVARDMLEADDIGCEMLALNG